MPKVNYQREKKDKWSKGMPTNDQRGCRSQFNIKCKLVIPTVQGTKSKLQSTNFDRALIVNAKMNEVSTWFANAWCHPVPPFWKFLEKGTGVISKYIICQGQMRVCQRLLASCQREMITSSIRSHFQKFLEDSRMQKNQKKISH